MTGHYPVEQGDPMALVLGAVLVLVFVAVVGAFIWFLAGDLDD